MAQLNLKHLARFISWLDGYASLSSTDPLKMERLVNEISSSGRGKKDKGGGDGDPLARDVTKLWHDVRKDVYDIANLPGESEAIMRVSKRVGIAKLLVPFLGAGVVLVFLVLSIFGAISVSAYTRIEVIILAVIAYNATLFLYMLYNRRLSSMVAEYYKKHAGEVASQRRRVKSTVQKLINMLASRVRARGIDPQRLRFALSNTDYANIHVLGEEKSGTRKIVAVKGRGE